MRRGLFVAMCGVAIVTARCSEYGSSDVFDAADAGAGAADAAAPPPADAGDAPHPAELDSGTDADAGCAEPCDCDGDQATNASCAPDSGLADCDDHDGRIRPGQDFVTDPWPDASVHLPAGDWDCDGKVTRHFPPNVSCSSTPCPTGGFAGDPPCGASAVYVTCQSNLGLECSPGKSEVRLQGCK